MSLWRPSPTTLFFWWWCPAQGTLVEGTGVSISWCACDIMAALKQGGVACPKMQLSDWAESQGRCSMPEMQLSEWIKQEGVACPRCAQSGQSFVSFLHRTSFHHFAFVEKQNQNSGGTVLQPTACRCPAYRTGNHIQALDVLKLFSFSSKTRSTLLPVL